MAFLGLNDMTNITIGCKNPHGLVLELGVHPLTQLPTKDYKCVVLNGLLKASAKARFAVTIVDEDFWKAWLKKNAKLRYVLDGSVFQVPLVVSAKA